MDTHTLLTDIENKIKKLKLRNLRLEKENADLQNSVFTYLQKMDLLKKQMEHSHLISNSQKIASVSSFEKNELKKEIDRYIYLIEKCIASVKVDE